MHVLNANILAPVKTTFNMEMILEQDQPFIGNKQVPNLKIEGKREECFS